MGKTKLNKFDINAFSLAEMMMVMLILTVVLVASTPIITKRATQQCSKTAAATAAVPVGTVIYFAGTTPPEGFLECNGQSTAAYANLAAIVGANVPDLRGEFVRGWDHGRGVDTGRVLNSWEADAYINHKHYQGAGEEFPILGYYANTSWRNNSTTSGTPHLAWTSGMYDMSGNALAGSMETRPRNIALMPCIKY